MNEKNKQNISIGQFKLVLVPLKRQSVLSGFAISDLSVWSVLFAPVSKAWIIPSLGRDSFSYRTNGLLFFS